MPIDGCWSLAQYLIPVERRPQIVVAKCVGQTQRMGRLHVRLDFQGLDPGGVLQDHSELGLVRLELLLGQPETGQTRNVRNIDLYRHRGGV